MVDSAETIVVGAGIAGLACARALASRGVGALLLERARGVGGRCATRRVDGVPVDHGAPFLHGRSDEMRAELEAIPPAERVDDWPRTRDGAGLPCQPEAFEASELRLAPVDGVNVFAKRLAEGLAIRRDAEVTAIAAGDSWEVSLAGGEKLRTRSLVLTMPAPEIVAFVRDTPIAAIVPTLELIRTVPCLTVIARYADHVPRPDWDASYPGTSPILQAVLHDSSKRARGSPLTLVLQARARFSRKHEGDEPERWTRVMLGEARRRHGAWIGDPVHVETHVWRHARVDAPSQLAGPLVLELPSGATLGLAGDGFHHAGGLEGAYLSGLALAGRLAGMLKENPCR
ncbi:MAG TPA: FAD-dependent oxidoreductase [Candidatus Polarisedimenticolaceae bacterium]|nr:FAD-dependent oxidoreductase [Candidatus Polarisedimenticolaceae bacterium]